MSRLLTNQCKFISVKFLKTNLYFFRGGTGSLSWANSMSARKDGIGFTVSMSDGDEHIRLVYGRKDRLTMETNDLNYVVRLTSTPCYFGGKRWWFRCPLDKNGQPCNRRVGVLYLGGGEYFGCRHCYNLAYESSQDSHRFERMDQKNNFPVFKTVKKKSKPLSKDAQWDKF